MNEEIFARNIFTLIVAAAAWAALSSATVVNAAPCSGGFSGGVVIAGKMAYDPFAATGVLDQYAITIANTGSQPCMYAVAFSAAAPPRLGGAASYDLLGANGQTALAPAPLGNPPAGAILSGVIAPKASAAVQFNVVIPPGQLAPPGSYSDNANVQALLYGVDNGQFTLLQTAPVSLTYAVSQAFGVNIAGGGTSTTLDFGALTQGDQKTVKIEARSNMRYHLRLSSDNGGAMALTPPVSGQKWTAPYVAALDGKVVDLSGAVDAPAMGRTTLAGDSHLLTVTIGDVSKKRAGVYKDTITVRITPN